MKRLLLLLALVASLAAAAAACGDGGNNETVVLGGDAELTAVPGNSELVVGPNRFALAFIDEQNEPLLDAPGVSVHFAFTGPGGESAEADARFVWAIPDVTGFYAANVEFGAPGQWSVVSTVANDGEATEVPFSFTVREEGEAPQVGDPAPTTENLTFDAENNIRRLTTDTEPLDAFYMTTVTEALESGEPFVVVFATPAFCQTRFCGPVVENVKEVYPDYGGRVTFIHIEPFELDDEGALAQGPDGNVQVRQPMFDWNLRTEPWVFVVDGEGTIVARFEGPAAPEELRAAIDEALS